MMTYKGSESYQDDKMTGRRIEDLELSIKLVDVLLDEEIKLKLGVPSDFTIDRITLDRESGLWELICKKWKD